MICYRLAREQSKDSLSGIGAAKYGGRWNSAGIEIVYTASSRALAMAELLVHLEMDEIPDDYYMMSIHIPDKVKIKRIEADALPIQWNRLVEYMPITRSIGNAFIQENKFCLLRVPSAVVKGDYNILINPYHKEFNKIKITAADPFPFDHRLFE